MTLRGLVALWTLVFLFGCETRRPEERLAVFNWTDYIGANTITQFEKATGATVSYDNYSSNEDLIAKLEAGGASYDVVFPSAYAVEVLLAKRMLKPLDATQIPNRVNILPEFASPPFDPELKFCIPYTWSTTAIAYDVREVTDEQAKSTAILFDARMKGKILMLDDMRASLGIALKTLGYSANSTSDREIAQAGDKLLAQKELVHLYASSNLPQLLASGEVKLAYAWSGDILQAIEKNPNIHVVIPREGSLVYVDYACIPSSAKNSVLGSRFINYLLEPAVAADIAETIKYALPNSKVRSLVSDNTARLWDQVQVAQDKAKLETVRNIGSALGYYDKAWQSVKSGR